ncbi:MAG: hypothetical protein NTU76_01060 [Candidatus Taylorbacteria bacterium]|nr:hypothetical protein [Candidatus Taylorbacteria bacterium]
MKKIIIGIFVSLFFLLNFSYSDAYVSVKGYYRSNGTYVAPHVRSDPNGLKYDNYSYKPSQGLYNKTYGTRGSKWDTPTWDTDPNYYQGKIIYDSGNNLDGYTIDKRPKGMSKRQFKALANPKKTNDVVKLEPTTSNIQKEVNNVKSKYKSNPDGFRERLVDQITNYLGADKNQVSSEVYRLLPDIK